MVHENLKLASRRAWVPVSADFPVVCMRLVLGERIRVQLSASCWPAGGSPGVIDVLPGKRPETQEQVLSLIHI